MLNTQNRTDLKIILYIFQYNITKYHNLYLKLLNFNITFYYLNQMQYNKTFFTFKQLNFFHKNLIIFYTKLSTLFYLYIEIKILWFELKSIDANIIFYHFNQIKCLIFSSLSFCKIKKYQIMNLNFVFAQK